MVHVAVFTWTGWQLSRGLSGNLPMDWVAGIRGIRTKRAQFLPDGGALPSDAFVDLAPRLQNAVAVGQQPGPMHRDDTARTAWHAVYKPLANEKNRLQTRFWRALSLR